MLVKSILNYQFGENIGDKIYERYKDRLEIEVSKNTGRARRIYIDKKLFGTIEPSTGFIILTYFGGLIVKEFLPFKRYRVVISDEAVPFVSEGKSVFCKFVIDIDENILPNDVVLVVDKNDNLIAVGVSILSAKEIIQFKNGVAVKIKDARGHYNKNI